MLCTTLPSTRRNALGFEGNSVPRELDARLRFAGYDGDGALGASLCPLCPLCDAVVRPSCASFSAPLLCVIQGVVAADASEIYRVAMRTVRKSERGVRMK
jgi:hypothetical protein